jgi:hypothetical protein
MPLWSAALCVVRKNQQGLQSIFDNLVEKLDIEDEIMNGDELRNHFLVLLNEVFRDEILSKYYKEFIDLFIKDQKVGVHFTI